MNERTLLEHAAEVREQRAALARLVQDLKQRNGDWAPFALAAEDAMRISDDGLRNEWQMLNRINQLVKAEIARMESHNEQ